MYNRRAFTRFIILFILLILAFVVNYCARSFPIISGYGAKVMCSGIFLAGRDEQKLRTEELGFFPIRWGRFTVNYKDSSVTGTVLGLARQKAIYRHGLGVTLVSEISEDSLRSQHQILAPSLNLHQDTLAWPMGDLLPDSFPKSINREALKAAIHKAFTERDPDRPVRTRAVIVLYDGQIVGEEYADGISSNTRLQGWSMTKSVTSALMGILVKQGKINIDSNAQVPEWADEDDPRHAITVKNLLQQSSGLDFLENYAKASDATIMLYERADMGRFTATHKLKEKPGAVFYYSSGNTNILSRLLRQTLGDSSYYIFPYDQLFSKIGMKSAIMEPDASGSYVGSSYMYATARDWARFGLLYYNDGHWLGKEILPAGWVQMSTVPASSCMKGEYGFQFWLNAGDINGVRKFPQAPSDLFYADGFESQYVFIIPSKKLVIVRLGLTQHNNFNAGDFLKEIIFAVK
jgi:CubicO group peptidase (beta-lactamase class C family)